MNIQDEDWLEQTCREVFTAHLLRTDPSVYQWSRCHKNQTPDYWLTNRGTTRGVEVTSFWQHYELNGHAEPTQPSEAVMPFLTEMASKVQNRLRDGLNGVYYIFLLELNNARKEQGGLVDSAVNIIRNIQDKPVGTIDSAHDSLTVVKSSYSGDSVKVGGHHALTCAEQSIPGQVWDAVQRELDKKANKGTLNDAILLLYDGFSHADVGVYETDVPERIVKRCQSFFQVYIIHRDRVILLLDRSIDEGILEVASNREPSCPSGPMIPRLS